MNVFGLDEQPIGQGDAQLVLPAGADELQLRGQRRGRGSGIGYHLCEPNMAITIIQIE